VENKTLSLRFSLCVLSFTLFLRVINELLNKEIFANVCNYFELRKNHAKKVLRYTFYVLRLADARNNSVYSVVNFVFN